MTSLVTLGETMAALACEQVGPLRTARTLSLSTAGSEATVAVGVRRLGHSAAWIGRLGADELGEHVRRTLLAERIAVHAVADADAPTGLMIKERRTADRRRVHYYRSGSAGSRLSPTDIPHGLIEQARVLHVSAITCALSGSAAEAVRAAVGRAFQAGVPVSFDANYRAALWSEHEARTVLSPLLTSIRVLFASLDEAQLLLATDESDAHVLARALRQLGPQVVVITLGSQGALSVGEQGLQHMTAHAVSEIDPVGAGDSFVGGYLASFLSGADESECLKRASRVAAFSVSTHGDWEGLPTSSEVGMPVDVPGGVSR